MIGTHALQMPPQVFAHLMAALPKTTNTRLRFYRHFYDGRAVFTGLAYLDYPEVEAEAIVCGFMIAGGALLEPVAIEGEELTRLEELLEKGTNTEPS